MLDREILEYLYDNYRAEYVDLTDFIFNKFQEEGDSVYNHIKQTLDTLSQEKEDLLIISTSLYKNLGNNSTFYGKDYTTNRAFVNFKEFKNQQWTIPAKITLKGKKEIEELRFKDLTNQTNKALKASAESSKTTNASLVTTNTSIQSLNTMTRKYYWVYLSLTALTAIFVGKQAFFTSDAKDLQPIYKRLEQIEQTQAKMMQSQKETSAFLQKVADSISSLRKNPR